MAEYTLDEFQALIAEIEDQGGAHMESDICTGAVVKDFKINDRKAPGTTCGCGNKSVFLVPYDGEPAKANKLHAVRVCAVCDGLGWMPRFKNAMPESF